MSRQGKIRIGFIHVLVVVVVALLALAHTSSALAAAEKTLVMIAEGPDAQAVRDSALAIVPAGFVVGDTGAFSKALAKQGHKGTIAKAIGGTFTREKLIGQIRRAAASLTIDAVVLLHVTKDRTNARSVRVVLIATEGTASALDRDVALPARTTGDGDGAALRAVLNGPLADLVPATEPEKPATAPPATATPSESNSSATRATKDEGVRAATVERTPGEIGGALFIVGLDVATMLRSFDYTDKITKNLRAYSVTGPPMAGLMAELYPLAASGTAVLKDLGLIGSYHRTFALKSAPQNGEAIDTAWWRYEVGLRGRLRAGSGDGAPLLGVSAAYGAETFRFSASGDLAAEVPSVDYRFVRVAIDGRYPIGALGLFAGLGYLVTSSSGDVGARFPRSKAAGVDAVLGGAIHVARGLEARISVDYRRFFYKMNPEPEDRYIAGGALDQLAGAHLGFAYVY